MTAKNMRFTDGTILMDTIMAQEVDLFEPLAKTINKHDVAQSLSKQCRYNGHIQGFYSVAEHCVLMARAMRRDKLLPRMCLLAMLHDATEAYLPDIPTPLKKSLFVIRPGGNSIVKYDALEDVLMDKVGISLAPHVAPWTPWEWEVLKLYDHSIVKSEWLALRPHVPMPEDIASCEDIGVDVMRWDPETACHHYLNELTFLTDASKDHRRSGF